MASQIFITQFSESIYNKSKIKCKSLQIDHETFMKANCVHNFPNLQVMRIIAKQFTSFNRKLRDLFLLCGNQENIKMLQNLIASYRFYKKHSNIGFDKNDIYYFFEQFNALASFSRQTHHVKPNVKKYGHVKCLNFIKTYKQYQLIDETVIRLSFLMIQYDDVRYEVIYYDAWNPYYGTNHCIHTYVKNHRALLENILHYFWKKEMNTILLLIYEFLQVMVKPTNVEIIFANNYLLKTIFRFL